jgi:hypothetical protein
MSYPEFSTIEIINGAQFLKEHGFHDILVSYRIPDDWVQAKRIIKLDEFHLYQNSYIMVGNKLLQSDRRTDLKNELLELASVCSSYEAGCYLYQVWECIQKNDE